MHAVRKERAIEPQPLPGMIWSETRCADQVEAKALLVLPDSRASSRKSKFLDGPIAKLKFLDK